MRGCPIIEALHKKQRFFVIFIFPFVVSCVSLKEVNEYAAMSVASLNKIYKVNYNFSDWCRQDCELQQMRSGKMDTAFACDCKVSAARADTAIQKIHFTILSYLKAIEKLSDNKGFTYDVSNLMLALQQNPLLQMTDAQVAGYTKAGNFIATAATAYYRKKKLEQYLGEADPVFQDLTETFIYLADNRLRAQLQIGYDTRMANINQLLDNAKNDRGFKQIAIKWFLDEQAYYKKHVALIDSYVALLRLVKKGHHDLYLQRNNLKNKLTKESIKRWSEDIQDIVASVKQ